MRARELMSTDPLTVRADSSLEEALERMLRFDIRSLPVVEGGRLVGIITDRDLKMILGLGARDVDEELLSEEDLAIAVREHMTEEVETIFADSPVSVACRKLAAFRIGALPVIEPDGELVGILSVTDCLLAAAPLFEEQE